MMVWTTPSALSPFRKIWGVITVELLPGEYHLSIQNLFNASYYGVDKCVVLINPNSLGYPKPGFIITHYILGAVNVVIIGFSTFRLWRFWKDKGMMNKK